MTESEKPPPELKKIPHSLSQCQLSNVNLGLLGEAKASKYLRSKNYHILAQNIRFKHGEIDIVAYDLEFNEVVFVEVKTRSTAYYGDPSLAVTVPKRRALIPVAIHWMKSHPELEDFRFDVISILPDSIRHLKNITW